MSDVSVPSVGGIFSVGGLRVAVTAAGQGIGRAMVERFVAAGAKVAACDIDGGLLDGLKRDLPDVHASPADVSNVEQVEAFFKSTFERLGGIDVLINNAGVGGGRAALEDIDYDDWNRTVAVNLNGMFYCIKQVTPLMKRQCAGCIINISTGSVRTGLPYRAPYVASKAGVMGLTHNVARELGEFNIRCNAILPGLMNNPRGHGLIQREADASGRSFAEVEVEVLKYISMRTWIEPSEIADAAIFLASSAGRHVSGQFLGVCGNSEWERLAMTVPPVAEVHGVCTPEFGRVQEVFEDSFVSGGELGASVAIYHRGVPVVELWGGFRDQARSRPWERDTIVCMMSVTKAMASVCLLTLIERGKVALDAPIALYWPEFAQAGKQDITVRHLLGHKTGVLFPDAVPVGALYQWEVVVDAIARQPAEWPAGAHGAYQSFTYGFMTGELVRRTTGLTIGAYFRREIAGRLGVDFHIGVPEADLPRVSDIGINPENGAWAAVHDLSTKLGRAWRAMPRGVESANTVDFRTHEFPSANGHGNAAGVARMFAALANGGVLDGVRILSRETVALIGEEQWDDICRMTDRPFRMGLGMFLAKPGFLPYGENPRSFGHAGIGGAVGFADPDRELAFSYCTSWMCEGTGVGRRPPALIDAMYASV